MTLHKDATQLTNDEHRSVELLRTISTEAATWAPRLERVYQHLHEDEHPLSGVDYDPATRSRTKTHNDEGGTWEIHDPTGDRAITGPNTDHERARARRLVMKLNDITRELTGMMQTYDAQPTRGMGATANTNDWCANPAHPTGSRAPRHGRHRHCRFCEDIASRYGQLPTAKLIDRHDSGVLRTLSQQTIRTLLDQ